MADIELVIKIPERIYDTIQDDEMISREQLVVLQMHILKGTPLPKGHGKIGDIDRLQEVFRRNVAGADAYKQLFDDAPTIIEADKDCHSCKTEYDCYECEKYAESEEL